MVVSSITCNYDPPDNYLGQRPHSSDNISPQDYLDAHNAARSVVGVGPLSWSNVVAAYAQNYAKKSGGDCNLTHSNGPYGENIFWGSSANLTAVDVVNAWVAQRLYYDYDCNTCASGQRCNHYTQVVWGSSTSLGCAGVTCNRGGVFITCNYDPPGNYVGQRPYKSGAITGNHKMVNTLVTDLIDNIYQSPLDFLDFLCVHNTARSQVGVGPLSWNNSVAAYARNYAMKRVGNCSLTHSGGPYGENIFLGSADNLTAVDAVNSWVTEKQYYDYDSNSCASGQQCGHYTQVVWGKSVHTLLQSHSSSSSSSASNQEKMSKEKPAVGIPYPYPAQQYYTAQNPYQAGMIPPNAVYADPKGIPLQQTIFRDTPAPFQCVYCGNSGITTVRSKPSLAAVVGCMMPFFLGVCFLCPGMDCLWHKYHYCPSCGEKVADFEKSDPCIVVDPPRWTEQSFAVPA